MINQLHSHKTWTIEELIEAVKNSINYKEVLISLKLKPSSNSYVRIKKYIEDYKLDTSHFKSQRIYTNEELFCLNDIGRTIIKDRILRDNLIEYKCDICKMLPIWENKKLSLHLDHINGINNDNRLENMRFLCPNCHSQTETYCGKKNKKHIEDNLCLDCKIKINQYSKKCRRCAGLDSPSKIEWPTLPEVIELVKQLGYEETGRQLGVCGNSVKKHIRVHSEEI